MTKPRDRRGGTRVSAALATMLLAAATTKRDNPPGYQEDCGVSLPEPTGPYGVGTMIDRIPTSRPTADFPGGLPLTLQYWYPASRGASPFAGIPYLAEPGLEPLLVTGQYYGLDSAQLGAWLCLRSSAALNAAVADRHHPLVTLSVGLGVIRANYTSLAMELASHGSIVAVVESPLAGLMLGASGRVIADTTSDLDPASHRQRVADWAGDVSYALTHLRNSRMPAMRALAAAVDWDRVGSMGHSSGGLVAIESCARDERVRACVNLDGGAVTPDNQPLAPFVDHGVRRPTLVIRSRPLYSDTDLAKRGLTREQWVQRGGAGVTAWDSVASRSRARLVVAFVAGTGHMSFSDAPFVMPSTITRFGGTIIDGRRGWLIITTLVREFFSQQLGQGREGDLERVASQYPEVELRTLRP